MQCSLVSNDNMIISFLLSQVPATDSVSAPEIPFFSVLSSKTSELLIATSLDSSMDIVSLLSHTEMLSSLSKPKMSSLGSLLSSVRPPAEMAPARWDINGVLEPSPLNDRTDWGDSKRSRRLFRLARRELCLLCLDSMFANQILSWGVTLYTLL